MPSCIHSTVEYRLYGSDRACRTFPNMTGRVAEKVDASKKVIGLPSPRKRFVSQVKIFGMTMQGDYTIYERATAIASMNRVCVYRQIPAPAQN